MAKPSSKNTKAQILSAYKDLEDTYKQLLKEKGSEDAAASDTVAVKPKEIEAEPEKGAEKTDMKTVIEALGQLGERFNSALSQLSGDLLVEASRLKDVLSGADAETRRLTELYDLEIGEETLSQLLREYTETEKACEKAFAEKRESLEKDLAKRRDAWVEEREETVRQMEERKASDGKTWERGISEYTYDLGLKRGMSDEEYAHRKNEQDQTLKDLRESRLAAWDEKEKLLSEREKQFREHKEKVESFPKELEEAVKKSEGGGLGYCP